MNLSKPFLIFGARNCPRYDTRGSKICYLGFEPIQRQMLRVAGFVVLDTSGLLSIVASRLKLEFIEYIGIIGSGVSDQVSWWATRIASKSNTQSDFFSVVCLLEVAREVLARDRDTMFVVDDARVFHLLRRNFAVRAPWSSLLRARGRLTASLLRAVGDVLLKRLYWVAQTALRQENNERVFSRDISAGLFVYSWVEDRSFNQNGKYQDPYLPYVERFSSLSPVVLFLPSNVSPDLCRKLRRAGMIFTRIDHYSTLFMKVRCALRIAGFRHDLKFRGLDLNHLWRSELLRENAGHYCQRLHDFYCWTSFFGQITGKLVFPFEGQPWEKMMMLAAKSGNNGFQLVGYQHSSIGELQLNYYTSVAEKPIVPLPDVLVANSDSNLAVLQEYVGERKVTLLDGGALRYQGTIARKKQNHTRKRLGIMMPVDKRQALEMLIHLKFSNLHDIEVIVKAHPDAPLQPEDLGPTMQLFSGTAKDLYEFVDGVLYCSGTSGQEAYSLGLPVFRYIGDFVDLQVGERSFTPRTVSRIDEISEGDLILHDPVQLFSPINETAWREILA